MRTHIRLADPRPSLKHVDEGGMARCDRLRESAISWHAYVDVQRVDRDAGRRAGKTDRLSGNDADPDAIICRSLGHILGVDILIARRAHFLVGRQIDPQLEAAHEAVFLLRHLGVHDAAAGGHPLCPA